MDLIDTNKRICCCSVDKSCLILCDPINFTTPNFLVLHYFPEFAQTHVYWVSDATQTSWPLLPPSFTLNLFHHQGLLQWGSSSHQVAKTLELQLQQWIFRVDFLQGWLVLSPCSPRDSQEPSPAPQSEIINSLASAFFIVRLSHPYMMTGKTIALTVWTFIGKSDVSAF